MLGVFGEYTSSERSLAKWEKTEPKNPKTDEHKNWTTTLNDRKDRVSTAKEKYVQTYAKMVKMGLLEEIKVKAKVPDGAGGEKEEEMLRFRIKGGPDQLRGILAANMPTLKYGTEFSGVLNASLATNSNPMMETIMMQRQRTGTEPVSTHDDGLPMTIKPVTLSLECFGCPVINFGQQFFVDFGTNTSIDDIYMVSGVSHSITPSDFKTNIKLVPMNKLGQYRSLTDTLHDITTLSEVIGKNIS